MVQTHRRLWATSHELEEGTPELKAIFNQRSNSGLVGHHKQNKDTQRDQNEQPRDEDGHGSTAIQGAACQALTENIRKCLSRTFSGYLLSAEEAPEEACTCALFERAVQAPRAEAVAILYRQRALERVHRTLQPNTRSRTFNAQHAHEQLWLGLLNTSNTPTAREDYFLIAAWVAETMARSRASAHQLDSFARTFACTHGRTRARMRMRQMAAAASSSMATYLGALLLIRED